MVPTLVDNLKKRVIVDSLNIMNYIDQVSGMHIIFLWFIYRKCRNHPFTLNPAALLLRNIQSWSMRLHMQAEK